MSSDDVVFGELMHLGSDTATYRGTRKGSGAPLVIKVTTDEHPHPRTLVRMRHEYALLMRQDGHGAPRALGLEPRANGLLLMMEALPGLPLDTILMRGPMPVEQAVKMAIRVLENLSILHAKHIVHKDIKPGNLLLDEATGNVSVVDFGISSELPRAMGRPAATGVFEGTPRYMSPEQTGMIDAWIDARSDLYSLGVTLYEALVGEPPFGGDDPQEIFVQVLTLRPKAPREVLNSIPASLSAVVMKALAKTPEDRYQSAQGFRRDLETCLRVAEPFSLGQYDVVTEPRPPQRLYGRDAEIEAFQSSFERSLAGANGIVLVSGEAGIGKSALIREVRKSILKKGGLLVEGKCDQLERALPYSAILRVLRDLAGKLITMPDRQISLFRTRFASTLGAQASVLTELCPELSHVLPEQPAAPVVGNIEAQARLSHAVQRFFRAFADPGRPLVFFLDDIQWSDAASLALVRALLQDTEQRGLLVVCGHRDVAANHPLTELPDAARSAKITPVLLRLGPLDAPSMRAFVADALGNDGSATAPLADLVLQKTAGNPFFAGQFLDHLYRDELLRFDISKGAFVFDSAAIAALPGTDNVLALITRDFTKLAEEPRGVLAHAACLGHQFTLAKLVLTRKSSLRDTAIALDPAVKLGLLVALDPEHRYFVHDEQSLSAVDFDVKYRFLHDRVQQAAYALVSEADKAKLHLQIGRALLKAAREDAGTPFEAVHHLGLGVMAITEDAERLSVARLHLSAAVSAKKSSAFDAADRYASSGIAMLQTSDKDAEPEFAYTFALEAAECAFLVGNIDKAMEHYEDAYARATTLLQKAEVERQRVVVLTSMSRYPEAFSVAGRGLSLLGMPLPESGDAVKAAVGQTVAAIQARLSETSLDALASKPISSDPVEIAIARFYIAAFPVTFYLDPALNALVTVKHFERALFQGHTQYSSHAYVTYGLLSILMLGAIEQAIALGKTALTLVEKHPVELRAQVLNMYGAFIAHYAHSHAECIEVLERSVQVGMETGDLEFAGYSALQVGWSRTWQGQDTSSLLDDIDRLLTLATRAHSPLSIHILTLSRQFARMLSCRTIAELNDDSFDVEAFAKQIDQPGLEIPQLFLPSVRAIGCLYAGDYGRALDFITEASRYPSAALGTSLRKEMVFYGALTRLLLKHESGSLAVEEDTILSAEIEQINTFARFCPSSFEHKRLLLAAEQAWLRKATTEGKLLHEQAMQEARKSGQMQLEALAAELCARHCLKQGLATMAADLLTRAYAIYSNAGYEMMARRLAAQHEELLSRTRAAGMRVFRNATQSTAKGRGRNTTLLGTLDIASTLETAEALGTEIEIDRLLSRFLGMAIACSGAQRAVLLLVREEGLRVEAEAIATPQRISVCMGIAFDTYEELPRSLVHYTTRSGDSVRLADSSKDERFNTDPYIVSRSPHSILAIPLLHRGRTIGVLYLENRALRGAFAGPRLDLLFIIAHQAAISLENARLYEQLRMASSALEEANKVLSEEALRRAAALKEATEELSRTNERLLFELGERERAEQLRASLQEEMIAAQRERLEELSTPLIPISEKIVVMPLIGTVDAQRAQRMLETVLDGASKSGATVVILDVTGVKSMDAAVAQVLLDTSTALRLLGSEAVITGIRPMAAQTLVSMGTGLSAIATRSTLQAGIAYALGRTRTSLAEKKGRGVLPRG